MSEGGRARVRESATALETSERGGACRGKGRYNDAGRASTKLVSCVLRRLGVSALCFSVAIEATPLRIDRDALRY